MEVFTNLRSAEEAGVGVEQLCVFGGGSKSLPLARAIADVTGRAIRTFATSEIGAFGAAKLAAKAAGIEGFAIQSGEPLEPDGARHERYREQYEAYQKNLNLILNLA